MKQLLSAAHARFRQLRSGELGDNLRAQGIEYKVIWGLESYRLREIAAEFSSLSDEERLALAEALWTEDVRESKMLATRLYPVCCMNEEKAQEWADAIVYTELADQACMNLFSRLPFAQELTERWIQGSEMEQYMAIQIALRLSIPLPQADSLAKDANRPMWLRMAAIRLNEQI